MRTLQGPRAAHQRGQGVCAGQPALRGPEPRLCCAGEHLDRSRVHAEVHRRHGAGRPRPHFTWGRRVLLPRLTGSTRQAKIGVRVCPARTGGGGACATPSPWLPLPGCLCLAIQILPLFILELESMLHVHDQCISSLVMRMCVLIQLVA